MKRPFAAILSAVLAGGCGGADAPTSPGSPDPTVSPSASPQGSGAILGAYLFEIRPAPSCGLGGPLTFPMTASATGAGGAGPYPGVQVLVVGEGETLQLELLSSTSTVAGGFGTTERGALSSEAVRAWVNAIGSGAVTRAADGRGQVAEGKLVGYIAFGHAAGPEGSLGSCTSTDHAYVLRAR
jgi:hypothetical protein